MNKSSFRQSVSAILIYKEWLYLVKRSDTMKDFPGYWAFPGGKLESKENHLIALQREIQEELGFDLSGEEVESCRLIGTLQSPDFVPYHFENAFYLLTLNKKEQFEINGEAEKGEWIHIDEIMDRFRKGNLLSISPNHQIYHHLYNERNLDEFSFELFDPAHTPRIEVLGGIYQLMPKSHTLPPFERTNCFYFKEAEVLVDPSPATSEEMDKLIIEVEKLGGVESILITHHHPDHYERANLLAQHWDAFILIHRETYKEIEKRSPSFFNDTFVFFVEEGESLGSYEEGEIIAFNLQGHAVAQICLADTNKRWFLAGDLFQGKGSVVLSGEPRSLSYYLDSLQFVIDYNPRVIIPSHGIALGGVDLLKRLKKHRLKREEQILAMIQQGLGIDEIVKRLYGNFSELLQRLGKRNVIAHKEKLEEEGRC